MLRTIDYSALAGPVAPTEVKQFRESARARPEYSSTSTVLTVVVVAFTLLIFATVLLGILGSVLTAMLSSSEGGTALTGVIVLVTIWVAFVAISVLIVRSVVRGGRWERWYRLDNFARANGMIFSPTDADPQYPGAIFQIGRARASVDHLRSASDRFVDYGNYRYTTGSGKNQSTRTWGFMALQLDRALPNMVLDSRANNGLFGSNLPAFFTKDQILHLEGNFDQYFTLYCPKEYERDALYVFTPDLMALLIDTAAPFDVEIVDQWMFVYSSSAFDLRQPAIHQRLLGIVDTVGAKTLTQTDRYSDERVGDFSANTVAPQGRRLKRGVSVGAIVLVVGVVVLWFWPFFAGMISAVTG